MFNIAYAYWKQKKYDDALAKYGEALAMFRRLHGEKHTQVAFTLHSIADIHMHRHELEEALRLERKAVKIYRRVLGNNEHSHMATTFHNIAIIHARQGKHGEALKMYEEALGIYTRTEGVDHRDLASLHYNKGQCNEGGGDKEGALESYREAQRIYGMHGISSDYAKRAAESVRRLEGSL